MHGRVKVRTSAEQQEAKRKDRERKIKLYRAGIGKLFKKRKDGIMDDEALDISSKLLCSNPDIYTIWNIRREIILYLKTQKSDEEVQNLMQNELHLTEQCLRTNPKSYAAWHHRAWVLDTMPCANWSKELALCNKYLELDERNFHTWDYRQYIVSRSEVSAEDEFAFSTQKITSNFSNYSSWHYRSRLLPFIYPDPLGKRPIREDKHKEELELVQNAAFTDPNDQSAWFYQRWLLGRSYQPLTLVQAYVSEDLTFVVLTKCIRLKERNKGTVLKLLVNNEEVVGVWTPSGCYTASHVWIFKPINKICAKEISRGLIEILLYDQEELIDQLKLCLKPNGLEAWSWKKAQFNALFTQGLTSVLEEELESCLQLLDLEPDSKWTLLTVVVLMQAIDRHRYQNDTMEKLDLLIKCDPLRSNYYKDLRSRYAIEYILEQQQEGSCNVPTMMEINLSGHHLTALYHVHNLALLQKVDLSNNQLMYSLPQLHVLQCCQIMLLDNNHFTTLEGMPSLLNLKNLSIKNNHISSKGDIKYLSGCCKLSALELDGNPIEREPDLRECIMELLPGTCS